MLRSNIAAFVVLLPACLLAADPFRERVVPVLERHCVRCHNDEDRKGALSLQTAEGAFTDGYIVAGEAGESHLLEVIAPATGRATMPKGAAPLDAADVTAIREWIAGGAKWPEGLELRPPGIANFDWWSYRPVERPSVPHVGTDWGRNPVDAFVLARLKERGLAPAPQADRRTLIRRVTYDLTGLPPTPTEVAAFVADPAPGAYERLVDRLLASPRYGERWARHWLDVVKYADTCGYDKDKLRPNAWPYRDYVVRSLNGDKPYSRFVREQIAGDVLTPNSPDGILGLGFLAAGPWDFIGHVEVPESKIDGKVARNLDRDDMVSNVLNTFCSVTVQCARCHDHEFDPVTQEDYYGLQAIFAAVDRAERPYDVDAEIIAERRRLKDEVASLEKQFAAVEKAIADAGGPRLVELDREIAALGKRAGVRKEPQFGYHSAIVPRADVPKWVAVEFAEPTDVARIVLHPCHDEFAGIGAGFGFPVRYRVEVATVAGDSAEWRTVVDRTAADQPNPSLAAVEFDVAAEGIRQVRLYATRLVERKGDHILALAELEAFGATNPKENLARGAAVRAGDSIEAGPRWGRANLTDGRWARPADEAAAESLAKARLERDRIRVRAETPERVAERDRLGARLRETRDDLAALPAGSMVYAAATHFRPQGNFRPTEGRPRPIHVLHRGNVQQPGEPAIPSVLPLGPEENGQLAPDLDEGSRRAAIAEWLTRPEHPLVWRSIVNRVWQYHFGRGLVETPNDFGRMGARPTHPELLDWLAADFRQHQSMKRLHRLIVTSSTYRQSSRHDDGFAEIDGANALLWRANRRRLSAEELRDSILVASGTLDDRMGGPGFYLFALEKTAHSPHFEYHRFDPADPASHRRSVYRFVVRSQPNPWMSTLDCADSSQSTPRRNETLTSLQALALLNNKFNLEMARRFAARLEREATTPGERIDRAMRLLVQRDPTDAERADLVAYAAEHGLANLCRVLFNLNEFAYVD